MRAPPVPRFRDRGLRYHLSLVETSLKTSRLAQRGPAEARLLSRGIMPLRRSYLAAGRACPERSRRTGVESTPGPPARGPCVLGWSQTERPQIDECSPARRNEHLVKSKIVQPACLQRFRNASELSRFAIIETVENFKRPPRTQSGAALSRCVLLPLEPQNAHSHRPTRTQPLRCAAPATIFHSGTYRVTPTESKSYYPATAFFFQNQ